MIESYLYILPIGYISLFLFFTFLKTINDKLDKLIFCSVCFSFFTMLIVSMFFFPPIITAFHLGLSATGIAYSLKDKYQDKWYGHLFLLELVLAIIGLIIITYFL